uniref:hypothetical protein n=1 Tax=Serratia marcescens TaxID=615 RepID=UPI00215D9A39|nr:hypothetical protein [Serratia marcescens]
MPLRITPSVAEQEGQQTETEATGAPQKHHYTLNQQVGSITSDLNIIPLSFYVLGFSYMDISNYISVPEKIVKKRIDRAKEKVLEVYPSFRAFVTDCYRSRKIYFFIENVYEYVMLINC